jgi:hypothetical protein
MSIACMSGTTDFTSMTSRERVSGWNARISTETSFAPNAERHLADRGPPQSDEQFERLVDEDRVAPIGEPVQALSPPEQSEVNSCAEFRGNSLQREDGEAICLTALDSADRRTRQACSRARARLDSSGAAAATPERRARTGWGASTKDLGEPFTRDYPVTPASGAIGTISPVGWTRKIQMSQVTWLTTSAPSGTPAA